MAAWTLPTPRTSQVPLQKVPPLAWHLTGEDRSVPSFQYALATDFAVHFLGAPLSGWGA